MQISSRFTIAVHILLCIETFKDKERITSEFLAGSINVNPVIIRKILQQLKQSGLVEVKRGSGGALLKKSANEITLLDIYQAVESIDQEGLFRFHSNPNPDCPVGKNIHNVLDKRLAIIQKTMEEKMATFTLNDLINDTNELITPE